MNKQREQSLIERNAELERELEIEASLERVRTVAMGMRKPDDLLDICRAMYEGLQTLGFADLRNAMVNILHDEQGFFLDYDFDDTTGVTVTKFMYDSSPMMEHQVEITRSGSDAFIEHTLTGNDLEEFKTFRVKNGEEPDPRLENIPGLYYYFYSIGVGSVGISTFSSLTNEHREILKRFRNIFDLAYRRYADIELAEAQAREAKIEAALERVRSRSMGMQKSDELQEVIQIVYEQFVHLNINIDHTGFVVDYNAAGDWHFWVADQLGSPAKLTVANYDCEWNNRFDEAKEKGIDFFAINLTFEEKNKFYRDLFAHAPGIQEQEKELIFGKPGLAISTVLLDDVALYIENYAGTPYTDDENATLMRFGKVFQQTYTRFLDLQKAEAQAREAQIEAALEKVRSRSLAMHKSDELDEVVAVVADKLQELGIEMEGAVILVPANSKKGMMMWSAMNAHRNAPPLYVPYGHPLIVEVGDVWESGVDYFAKTWSFEDKDEYWKWAFTNSDFKYLPEFRKNQILAGTSYALSTAFSKNSGITIPSHTGHVLSDKDAEILKRFGKVFEQAYIRFLDLQKAEAQAREAQIEAALERVRSRAMAMHKTDELLDAAELLYKELTNLGIESMAVTYSLMDEAEENAFYYSINPVDGKINPKFFELPHDETDVMRSILSSWKKKEPVNMIALDEQATLKHQTYIAEKLQTFLAGGNINMTFSVEAFLAASPKKAVIYTFNFAQGYIFIIGGARLTTEQEEIVLRFTKVFELTYRRFLDIKQAEEQARESQIQLALERVRARTMAMQKSEELAETVYILFQQFKELGENPDQATIGIINEEENVIEYWVTMHGEQTNRVFKFSIDEPHVTHKIYKAWKEHKKSLVIDLAGKDLLDFMKYRASMGGAGVNKAEKRRIINVAFFSKGLINVQSTEERSEESIRLLERFAGVFDGTYTRFLDLKQAEGQAKESQIQLALERVRARTSAMQKSEELHEVIQLVFDQLHQLNFKIDVANFAPNYKETDDFDLWLAVASARYAMKIHVPYFEHPMFDNFNKAKKKEGLFTDILSKDEKNSFFEHFFKYTPTVADDRRSVVFAAPGFARSAAFMKNTALSMMNYEGVPYSEAENNVLLRFGQVFDQTYTRFSDLKQAEEQARESQIQLALERVRARTMAMQHSEELAETAGELFQQLHALGIIPERVFVGIPIDGTRKIDLWGTEQGGTEMNTRFEAETDATHAFRQLFKALEDKAPETEVILKGKDLAEHMNYVANVLDMPLRMELVQDQRVLYGTYFSKGWLVTVTPDILSRETLDILQRFAAVFDQTYTRFLDLERAEAQAREGQIQLGLERVRAKAMSMQNSDELNALVGTVFEELTKLDFILTRCLIMIFDPVTMASRWWMANSEVPEEPANYLVQNHNNPAYLAYLKAWHGRVLQWQYALKGKVKRDWDDFLFVDTELSSLPGVVIEGMKAPEEVLLTASFNNFGCLTLVSIEPLSDEHSDILLRFAKVFDMSYTRFSDLKQAEAQAHESRIQLGLERVRAAAMAMHDSAGVSDATALVFTELYKLGINTIRCGVCIIDGAAKEIEVWSASQQEGKISRGIGKLDMTAHPLWMYLLNAWKDQAVSFVYELKGKELADYYHIIKNAAGYHAPDNKAMYNPIASAESEIQYCNCYIFKEGCLFTFTHEPFLPETGQVLEKFAAVFGLTYRRYLDLKKAEAQVREAQIEAALERVRSKTMAMHNSKDVGETVILMFNELVNLGVDKIARCGIAIPDNRGLIELWTAKLSNDEKEEVIIGHIDTSIHPMLVLLFDAWKSKQANFEYILEGDDLTGYITAINNSSGYPIKYDVGAWGTKQYHNDFFFHEGMVFAFTFQPLSAEVAAVFKRFAGVFGQTYRRYLDLQKAEAAAREAQIEAALERVRSKAMAMRSSEDLNATANTVFVELRKLGVDLVRCGVGLLEKQSHISTIHAATNTTGGASLEVLGKLNLEAHPVLDGIYKHWRLREDYFPVLEGKSLKDYYKKLQDNGISVPEFKKGEKQYGYFFQFPDGCLYAWSGEQESEGTIKTLKRFTSVIGLTYTRYIELQKAELNAKEAIKQASLDRVRAEIASMRKQSDLERITPLIWNELTILGIPFIRCGVFIMDEGQKLIHTFLSTPDGKAIGAFHVPFDTSGNFEKMVDSWRHKVPYIDHWKEEAFSQFADTLVKQGAIASKAQYMRTLPHEGIHLNFLPFLQGMLYVGNSLPIVEDDINLVQAVADAFSTAYARYEDFNKLEAAKEQVDNALTQLKATQTKLIQSEKMASLGELTAGIAHEIQNPLNFVNNFSEVSAELIDEMDEELDKGDIEEAKAIARDIKDNLEKIRHHGGRADGIVKGMLQHSRTGGGEKQPTNINALADEFLRLSYHGLRAKDKVFNAEMVTNFDEKLPKISVIAQDIGRVLLNLFNNAFYAVNQKMKTAPPGYKPEVTVTTTTEKGQLVIKVRDNGVGMPEHIKDKIMQPFFTTKPTGEGTGLGLSLSYDMVVKGHGGTINVETQEGEFTEFTVTLPL